MMTKRYVLGIIGLVSAILIIWVLIHNKSATEGKVEAGKQSKPTAGRGMRDERTVTVRAANAQLKDHRITTPAIGTIDGNLVAVQPKVAGQLLRIRFTEGAYVEKGQVLAEIDNKQYLYEVQQTKARLASSLVSLQQAQNDLKRSEILYQQQSISKQAYETQLSQVAQLRASVAADQASMKASEIHLNDSLITAPVSGIISLQQVDVGNYLSASEAGVIAYISVNKPTEVAFSLPSALLTQVLKNSRNKKNMAVQILASENGEVIGEGTLSSIEQRIQKETGTFPLKAQLTKVKQPLFANDFVRVRLEIDQLNQVVTIPAHAVLFGKKGYYVWVALNAEGKSKATRKNIVLGPRVGEEYIVLEGLEAGSSVVTDGVDQLTEGARLNVVENISESTPQ